MANLIFLDTETTGLDHREHGIWQLAGIIEIDGVIKEEFDFVMDPGDVPITKEAMEIGGTSEEELRTFDFHTEVFEDFLSMLEDYVDKYDTNSKFFLIAYNSRFDDGFVREWFNRNGDKYYGSYFYSNFIDVHTLAGYVTMGIRNKIKSYKLGEICEVFGITLENAHDALSDTRATYELFYALKNDHLTVKL